ncbi:MAG: 2-phosphosulfolactate phosphatase [Actinomycetota bacterium]|nr:2-phosphosulfolactate phosphatase [Actinomycetota bacterium]
MIIVDVLYSNRINKDTLTVKLEQSVCGVIDVIRATSTIVVLLKAGCSRVIVAADKNQAYRLKKKNPDYILCGEEGGLAPPGFDYGNSPLELSGQSLIGRTAILKTTNGTVSMHLAQNCISCLPLSLLNLHYGLGEMASEAKLNHSNILLICSGQQGRIAYDDVFVAGLAVKHLLTMGGNFNFTDSAKLVLTVALSESSPKLALEKSSSGQSLKAIGLEKDIDFCARLNHYNINGKLVNEAGLLQIVPV